MISRIQEGETRERRASNEPERILGVIAGTLAIALRVLLLIGLLAAPALFAQVDAASSDPRPAPGLDPGGPAVAVIADGFDYTQPDISARLARDGEGEPIALDLADGDVRPYAPGDSEGTQLARALIEQNPDVRIVMARVPDFAPGTLARALGFAVRTPALIVALSRRDGEERGDSGIASSAQGLIEQAAAAVPDKLFVLSGSPALAQSNANVFAPPPVLTIPETEGSRPLLERKVLARSLAILACHRQNGLDAAEAVAAARAADPMLACNRRPDGVEPPAHQFGSSPTTQF